MDNYILFNSFQKVNTLCSCCVNQLFNVQDGNERAQKTTVRLCNHEEYTFEGHFNV